MNTDYRPISCEFHDLLEALATTRKPAQIRFAVDDESGHSERFLKAVIVDVYARDGVEYLETREGRLVRLDRLVEVDGVRLADFCESAQVD